MVSDWIMYIICQDLLLRCRWSCTDVWILLKCITILWVFFFGFASPINIRHHQCRSVQYGIMRNFICTCLGKHQVFCISSNTTVVCVWINMIQTICCKISRLMFIPLLLQNEEKKLTQNQRLKCISLKKFISNELFSLYIKYRE